MDATRVGIVGAIVVLLAAIGLYGVPMVMLTQARGQLDSLGCGGDRAPGDGFFDALDLVDRVASFPGFRARADEVSAAAALECMDHYVGSCAALRDGAVDAARDAQLAALSPDDSGDATQLPVDNTDWRAYLDAAERDALCTRWSAWSDWLDDHGLDAGAGCAVCSP